MVSFSEWAPREIEVCGVGIHAKYCRSLEMPSPCVSEPMYRHPQEEGLEGAGGVASRGSQVKE